MSRIVYVLNGPNLNLLGKREPDIYGHEKLGLELDFRQTNAEFQIVDTIHEARERAGGIIINPAAFSHYSIALLDALKACSCPILEVHISNIHQREEFRHHSYVSHVAQGVICGFGTQGYLFALERMAGLLGATVA